MQISIYAIPGKQYKEALPSMIDRVKPDEMIALIQENVLSFYNVTAEQVFRRSRKRELVLARQIMHYLAKKYTTLSLVAIGKYFPNKIPFDHTSVRHSIQTVLNLMETDKTIQSHVHTIEFNMGCDKDEKIVVVTPDKKIKVIHQLAKVVEMPLVEREITLSESEKTMKKYL